MVAFHEVSRWLSLLLGPGNVYGLGEYCRLLASAGFDVVQAESIRDQVLVPYEQWCRRDGFSHVLRLSPMLLMSGAAFFLYPWDYVIIKVRKP